MSRTSTLLIMMNIQRKQARHFLFRSPKGGHKKKRILIDFFRIPRIQIENVKTLWLVTYSLKQWNLLTLSDSLGVTMPMDPAWSEWTTTPCNWELGVLRRNQNTEFSTWKKGRKSPEVEKGKICTCTERSGRGNYMDDLTTVTTTTLFVVLISE